jgi:hypothetical protein
MQRIDIGAADIRIGVAVVLRVEVAGLRLLRGGFGLQCQGRLRGKRSGSTVSSLAKAG